MRNLSLLLLIGLVVLSACGVREQPLIGEATPAPAASATSAPQPAGASPAPDRTSGAVPAATPEITATALPMITNQVVLLAKPSGPGPRLLRDAWAQSGLPGVVAQTLLYSFLDYDAPQDNSAFYRLTLGGAPIKEEIVRIPNSGLEEPTYGYLSPDGQYIAYLVDAGENQANLRMMRVDGSEDRFITGNVFTVGSLDRCYTNVSWSPDSSKIAFHRYNENGTAIRKDQQIGLYDVQAKLQLSIVSEHRWSELVGWINSDEIAVFDSPTIEAGVQFVVINTKNNNSREINSNISLMGNCYSLSPDGTRILFTLSNKIILINTITGRSNSIQVQVAMNRVIWSPNSRQILGLIQAYGISADTQIITLNQNNKRLLSFLPIDKSAVRLLDSSPDGRYIAACDTRWSPTEGVVAHFLLYDSQQSDWYVVEQGVMCPSIIGWLTSTDTVTR